MRAFIAIDLETGIKAQILGLLTVLRNFKADIRWVKEAGLHLTLKFLGETEQSRLEQVKQVMAAVCKKHRPFPAEILGTGYFPQNRRSPRVLWIGVKENPELLTLQENLEAGLDEIGFPRESRPFRPHLTLGRIKSPVHLQEILAELEREKDKSYGAMIVSRLILFESILRPSGAEYRNLFETVLG